MNRRILPAAVAVLLAVSTVTPDASAQTEPLDTQRFRPHVTHDGILSVEGTETRYALDPWSAGLWLNYGHNPLVIDRDGEVLTQVVGGALAFDLTASYAFADWFELGLDLPFASLSGDDVDTSTACFPDPCPTLDGGSELGLGDLRLVPKFNVFDDRTEGFGLALVPELRLPTHSSDFYGGDSPLVFVPRVLLGHRVAASGLRFAGEAGATLRRGTTYANVEAGSELDAAFAVAYRFDMGYSPVELAGTLRAGLGLVELDDEEFALEALGALNIYLGNDWRLTLGGGAGVIGGYGTPTARFLLGFRWEPSYNDRDGDGRPDRGDDERLDDYRDPDKNDDGKVDDRYDRDGDGKVDEAYDEDGDGRVDDDVARKEAAEDPDKDGDGKVDSKYDRDGNGKLDKEFDQDGDGKLDDDVVREEAAAAGQDLCPELPEDFDGIEDDDGCPEGDEDGDGVVDLFDRCPDEAEVINGFEDDDGCPDEGPAMVVVEEGRIKVLATIKFKTGSDELEDESKPIMEQLVLTLRARQDVRRVRIEGHTDSTGSRDLNMRLSQERADSVKRYMVERGIRSNRLEAVGFGPDKPIADNGTEEGRALNRRVEFVIIQR